MTKKIKALSVSSGGIEAGTLLKDSQFRFSYGADTPDKHAVSLTMPVTARDYVSSKIPPVFEMNLPEGYLRQRIIERFQKHATVDEMFFLALQGENSIGRLGFLSDSVERDVAKGMTLAELVKVDNPALFEQLVEKYLGQTTIAGVQPKVLVPDNSQPKSALQLPDLIVKTSGHEFPHLAINEFICMSIAKQAGLAVPEFHLSDDKRLFIMRRFDLSQGHKRLGMEDICVLIGLVADDKYKRSYEQVARAVSIYSEKPNHDLAEFFRSLCVSVLVGNGDAHLKNFAMLYDDPKAGKGWLSPAFDIVNTTVYMEGDTLALKLSKTKDFPNRTTMIRFGREHCNLTQKTAEEAIDLCIGAVQWGIEEFRGLAEPVEFEGRTLIDEIENGVCRLMKPEDKQLIWKGEVRKPKRTK